MPPNPTPGWLPFSLQTMVPVPGWAQPRGCLPSLTVGLVDRVCCVRQGTVRQALAVTTPMSALAAVYLLVAPNPHWQRGGQTPPGTAGPRQHGSQEPTCRLWLVLHTCGMSTQGQGPPPHSGAGLQEDVFPASRPWKGAALLHCQQRLPPSWDHGSLSV